MRLRLSFKDSGEGYVSRIRLGIVWTRVVISSGQKLTTTVMDELTMHIQDEVAWCMLFGDDIILVDEIRKRTNTKVERRTDFGI